MRVIDLDWKKTQRGLTGVLLENGVEVARFTGATKPKILKQIAEQFRDQIQISARRGA